MGSGWRTSKWIIGQWGYKNTELSLSGGWLLAEDGLDGRPEWDNSIQAIVPGSIHEVLFKAGRIPDPMIGRNDSVAEKHSYHRWWLKRIFENENIYVNPKLRFAGVANHCWVWLNGHCLGEHEGMFGGPDFEIKEYLKAGKMNWWSCWILFHGFIMAGGQQRLMRLGSRLLWLIVYMDGIMPKFLP